VASPEDMGLSQLSYNDIRGGESVEESASIFLNILEGRGTPQQNAAVIANAAMALFCVNQKSGFQPAVEQARESLVSGKAYDVFKRLLNK